MAVNSSGGIIPAHAKAEPPPQVVFDKSAPLNDTAQKVWKLKRAPLKSAPSAEEEWNSPLRCPTVKFVLENRPLRRLRHASCALEGRPEIGLRYVEAATGGPPCHRVVEHGPGEACASVGDDGPLPGIDQLLRRRRQPEPRLVDDA